MDKRLVSSTSLPAHTRSMVLAFIIVIAFLDGATINWIPITYQIFADEFGAGLEAQGRSWGLFFLGGIAIAAVGGWLTRCFGLKGALAAALLIFGVGLSIIGLTTVFWIILLGCFLFGIGNSWITILYNTTISSFFPEIRQRLYTWANVSLSVGAFSILPLLGTWFETPEYTGGWRTAYGGLGLALVGFSTLLFLIKTNLKSPTAQQPRVHKVESAIDLILRRQFFLIGICFLLYAMAQFGISSWVAQLYRERLPIDDGRAGLLLGVNSIGYLLGLLTLGWYTRRRHFNERILLGLCTGAATIVLAGLILNHNYHIALALMIAEGAVVSGSGPALYSFVGGRFPEEGATAFALLMGFSRVGSASGPYIVGLLGEELNSLETAMWVLPIFSGLVAVMSLSWEFLERRRSRGT